MSGAGKRPRARRLLSGLAVTVIAGVIVAVTLDTGPGPGARAPAHANPADGRGTQFAASSARSPDSPSPCSRASASTIAAVDATAAQGIYAGELRGNEVSADIAHITGSRALLTALARKEPTAVYAAVHAIVYAPRWHIVRLRVVSAGRVIADVGGPDVIAPVSGSLTFRGRTVGTYVMSVQDDAGYVKLVSRFIGVPIDLYRNGAFLMGTLQPAPPTVSAGASLAIAGNAYHADVLSARAFPTGGLRVALLVASPSPALASMSCRSVRLAAWASIAMHIAARLRPLPAHYQDLVHIVEGTTGGLVYVRSGSTRIAGGAGPARLPDHGTVRYAGRSWALLSWEPAASTRVYFLTPPT